MAEQDADNSGLAEGRMTLIGHLTELRNRLGVALGVFLLLFLISVAPLPGTTSNSIAYQVFVFLQAPLAEILNAKGGGRMIFTGLHEGFFTQVKVSFFVAISITFPLILLQVWKFVAPGLYKTEKQAVMPFLMATPLLFILGAAMVYYIVIPLAWDFFLSFEVAGSEGALPIEVEPRISEYLSLVMRLMFAFGVSFELPVILLLLVRAGILTADDLAGKRKYAILLAFIAAAILTPPDVISQVLLAVPVIILYELSIVCARFMAKPSEPDAD